MTILNMTFYMMVSVFPAATAPLATFPLYSQATLAARELRYKSRVIDQRTETLPTSLVGTFFMSRDTISSLAVLAAWTVAGK